jgi:hypothetical protein
MKSLTMLAVLLAAQDSAKEALKADIEAMRPARHVWREIAWKNCPLEALKEAREQKKPVLIWVFLGSPSDERC